MITAPTLRYSSPQDGGLPPRLAVRRALAKLAVAVAALAILGSPLGSEAQQSGKRPRIGLLDASSPRPELWAPLKDRLRELGYVEGQSIVFESRWAHDKVERLPDLVAELVALRPDVLVTTGTRGRGPYELRP